MESNKLMSAFSPEDWKEIHAEAENYKLKRMLEPKEPKDTKFIAEVKKLAKDLTNGSHGVREQTKSKEYDFSNLQEKKDFLDNLYYCTCEQNYDFFLSCLWKVDDEVKSTKWKKFSECVFLVDENGNSEDKKIEWFFKNINQRQILPFEIVLDIEERNGIKEILNEIKKWNIEFSVYDTGSRGYHIHILYSRDLKKREKTAIIKKSKADMQKDSNKTMIALENSPHWKTGKIKRELTKREISELQQS